EAPKPAANAEPTKPVAGGATPAPAAKPAAGAAAATIDFWIFDEFATGQALDILNDFIKQFESANAGVKINAIGKPSQNISQGLITGAWAATCRTASAPSSSSRRSSSRSTS